MAGKMAGKQRTYSSDTLIYFICIFIGIAVNL